MSYGDQMSTCGGCDTQRARAESAEAEAEALRNRVERLVEGAKALNAELGTTIRERDEATKRAGEAEAARDAECLLRQNESVEWRKARDAALAQVREMRAALERALPVIAGAHAGVASRANGNHDDCASWCPLAQERERIERVLSSAARKEETPGGLARERIVRVLESIPEVSRHGGDGGWSNAQFADAILQALSGTPGEPREEEASRVARILAAFPGVTVRTDMGCGPEGGKAIDVFMVDRPSRRDLHAFVHELFPSAACITHSVEATREHYPEQVPPAAKKPAESGANCQPAERAALSIETPRVDKDAESGAAAGTPCDGCGEREAVGFGETRSTAHGPYCARCLAAFNAARDEARVSRGEPAAAGPGASCGTKEEV